MNVSHIMGLHPLQQIFAGALGQLLHSHVVDDQKIGLEIFVEDLLFAAERFIVQEVADDIEDRAVEYDKAALDSLVAQGLSQHRLAAPRTPGGPSHSTSPRSRMKRQVARS